MSYIGTNKLGTMYLGDNKIAKAYLGDDLVYSSEVSPYVFYNWVGVATGSNVFFNTDIRILSTMTFQVDLIPNSSSWSQPISCWKSGYTYSSNNVLYIEKNGSTANRYNLAVARTATGFNMTQTSRHTILYDHGVKVDSSWVKSNVTPYDMESDVTLKVSGPKIYSIKIWDSGTAICELVPAQEIATGNYGMYDKVRDIFLLNYSTSSTTTCGN